ncbi:MAG: hypothetical protein VYC95_05405, partial [Verrucomicrobiota bacterium]|nr:hypothetical protein [Verrucomicrobiota bacterium]
MTRDELFERYVADALDEDALAELASRREEDVEFAAQFDADLVATGKFRKAGGAVERIEKGQEGAGDRKDSEDEEDEEDDEGEGDGSDKKKSDDGNKAGKETPAPKRARLIVGGQAEAGAPAPKLIMGESAEMPKALQFLGIGEEPPPGFYDQAAAESTSVPTEGEAVPGQENLPVMEAQPVHPIEPSPPPPPAPPEVTIPVEMAPLVAEEPVEETVEDIVGGAGDGEDRDESRVVGADGFAEEEA